MFGCSPLPCRRVRAKGCAHSRRNRPGMAPDQVATRSGVHHPSRRRTTLAHAAGPLFNRYRCVRKRRIDEPNPAYIPNT